MSDYCQNYFIITLAMNWEAQKSEGIHIICEANSATNPLHNASSHSNLKVVSAI
jgi:hypothetical protein